MKVDVGIGCLLEYGGLQIVEIQWSFYFIISLTVRHSKEIYVLSLVQILMSRCPLYMHAIRPPGLFSLCLSMTFYPSPEMLASSICRS